MSSCAANKSSKIASNFPKFQKTVRVLRVNEAKLTSTNVFINNVSVIEHVKESENDEGTLFWDFLLEKKTKMIIVSTKFPENLAQLFLSKLTNFLMRSK